MADKLPGKSFTAGWLGRHTWRSTTRRGQSIVELAFVLSLFILFVIAGIIDFGFAMHNLLTLNQLANDAAQYAAESNGKIGVQSASLVQNYVMQKRPATWVPPITVTYVNPLTLPSGDRAVRVTLESTSPLLTPVFQALATRVTGTPSLPLRVFAVYKLPLVVANR